MAAPQTPKEWSVQVALGALVVAVLSYFMPEKRAFLIILLIAVAIGSWVVMKLRNRRTDNGEDGK